MGVAGDGKSDDEKFGAREVNPVGDGLLRERSAVVEKATDMLNLRGFYLDQGQGQPVTETNGVEREGTLVSEAVKKFKSGQDR